MKLLLFAGAGTSVELSVPVMTGMAEEFLAHAQQWNVDPGLVERMLGKQLDIEYLIEALDHVSSARPSLEVIGQEVPALDTVDRVRAEVEWFVQHVAERVVAADARLMWGPVLRQASRLDRLTLVTTNYDRAIELAANAEGVPLDDGFGPFDEHETSSWRGFGKATNGVPLVKLHGSTDWYSEAERAIPTKLRHPMPLFGRATLRLRSGEELGSALILPSREKLLSRDPYPRLSQTFLNAADSCDLAVFVGTSMRDDHVRSAAGSTAQRVPLFIVNPDGETYGISGAQSISQTASMFLLATLPNALSTSDPVKVLSAASQETQEMAGLLDDVRTALDTDAPSELRCVALERIDQLGAPLAPEFLSAFLTDANEDVARYSLGLIPLSESREALFEEASTSSHAQAPRFVEDLRLLRELLADASKAT